MDYIGNGRMNFMHKFKLAHLPQFLRFDCVELDYQNTVQTLPIAEKCQSVVNYLKQLKLNDSSLIHFIVAIKKNKRTHFSNHSQFLDHLRNELLPICGSSRAYKFDFFSRDETARADLIEKILIFGAK